jgi:PAS domain S-box-containing protein
MKSTLRVLHVEDSLRDAALVTRHLSRAGFELFTERVQTASDMRAALEGSSWDVILCDYSMPQFNALSAIALTKELKFDIPLIIISGTVGEATAVEAMLAGAQDYMMKDSLVRLVPAIQREMKEAQNRRAKRLVEKQLRLQSAALAAAAHGIIITDPSGAIIWVNPAFTIATGYSFAEVQGKNPRLLNSGKQDEGFYREMWATILAGKVWRNTMVNRRKDGTFSNVDMTITPMLNDKGEITHFIGIKHDITQLHQALAEVQEKKDELAEMTQQLWQASKLATMGELSASIAHELNNPLATVALRVENLLLQMSADDAKRQPLEVVTQEVDRMARLVDNLLEFSRRNHRQVSTVDVCKEIDNSIEFVHYHLRTRKIEVVREFAANVSTIQADRQQLRQLFLNLLTNAGDAMPNGGQLTMRAATALLEEREAVVVEVEDSGEGIPAENLERIWEPFFSTKPEGKGTGLGLAICRRIVEEHGGTIDIHCPAGAGTTVRLLFPATARGNTGELL